MSDIRIETKLYSGDRVKESILVLGLGVLTALEEERKEGQKLPCYFANRAFKNPFKVGTYCI